MTHRTLIVAAVSTVNQAADDKVSIPQQLADCRRTCAARGWPVTAEITIPGHSRNYNHLAELVADCPEYGQVIRTISSGDVSLVVARDYDRLWRTDALRAQVTAICREHQVQVYALNQPVEPLDQERLKHASNDGARWVETVGGLVAESENSARVRRSKSGKEALVRQGYTMYANNIPYGYTRNNGERVIRVDPVEAHWVRWIFERRAVDRWGYQRIANELNRQGVPAPRAQPSGWLYNTIKVLIKRPVYYGATRWGAASCEVGKHEPLITRELWQSAQLARPVINTAPVSPLTGLLVCGSCGYHMVYSHCGPERLYMRCGNYANSGGRLCCCNNNRAKPIEDIVYEAVHHNLTHSDDYITLRREQAAQGDNTHEVATVDREVSDLTARLSRWSQAYELGSISLDELLGHRQRLKGAIDDLQTRRHGLLTSALALDNAMRSIIELAPEADKMATHTAQQLHDLYARLIHHVTVQRGVVPVVAWL